MPEFTSRNVVDLLDEFASSTPVPGGGSAAALTASIGVSLLLMVASNNRTRTGTPEALTDLAACAARLRPIRDELVALIDDDGRAYLGVLAAYRKPKGNEAETATRHAAIANAVREATETPLRTARSCERALHEAITIARHGNPNAVTDAVVGAKLVMAALDAAGLNVVVNLPGVKDAAFAGAAEAEQQTLVASGRTLMGQVQAEAGVSAS